MNAKLHKLAFYFLSLIMALALTFGPLGASPARAAGISVNSTAQEVPFDVNGNCTLGEAIFAANVDAAVDGCAAGSGSDEIFVPAGVYLLHAVYDPSGGDNLGLPKITSPITITGALAGTTIIRRAPTAPAFRFLKLASGQALTLNNLTFENGLAAPGQDGGAVNFNHGTLTVNDSIFRNNRADGETGGALASNYFTALGLTVNRSIFSDNTAAYGGAIHAFLGGGGIISINDSAFTGNTATSSGGAFAGRNSAVLNISNSTFTGNTGQTGGALSILDMSGSITGSVFTDNHATAGYGGGISMLNTGAIAVINSVIVNNTAFRTGDNAYGGGISQEGTGSVSLTITGSTIAGNTVYGSGGGVRTIRNTTIRNSTISGNSASLYGGGINDSTPDGELKLYNVTLTGNSSAYVGSAGGIHRWGPIGARLYAQNTIIAGNTNSAGGYPDCYTSGGSLLVSTGYVLLGNNTGCTFTSGAGDIVGTGVIPVDARLAPLADNGGATETHALYSDSPAINAGSPTLPGSGGDSCEAADQRGVIRPQNGACDIGAYEATPAPEVSLSDTSLNFGDQLVNTTSAAQTVTVTNVGSLNLNIGSLSISGEFGLSNDTCSGATLIPSGTCAFDVTFSPLSVGNKAGSVSIPSNAIPSPDTVALSGNGVDAVAPNTTILTHPAASTTATSAAFTFTGSDDVTPVANLTYQCKLDGGAFTSCTSPQNYSGLAVGSHTFQVRAIDGASNVDATPASYTWTIVAIPPTQTIKVVAGLCYGAPTPKGKFAVQATDPENDDLTMTVVSSSNVTLVPKSKVVLAKGLGNLFSIIIEGKPGQTGTSVITLKLSDGSSFTNFTINFIVGTSVRDVLTGTNGLDMLFGMAGNDSLRGRGDSDLLCGGAGNDSLTGGLGNDYFGGGDGTDTVTDFSAAQGDKKDKYTP